MQADLKKAAEKKQKRPHSAKEVGRFLFLAGSVWQLPDSRKKRQPTAFAATTNQPFKNSKPGVVSGRAWVVVLVKM